MTSRPEERMTRSKILHVYKDFHVYNSLLGSLLLLAKRTPFEKYELKCCVFSYRKSPWGREFERLGGEIIDLGMKWTESPMVIPRLVECFKRERPSIVQTHELKANLYGRIAAKIAGVPVIIGTKWTLKDTAPSRLRRFRDLCLHPFCKILDQQSSKVVTCSDAIRREWDASLSSPLYQKINLPYDLTRDVNDVDGTNFVTTSMGCPGSLSIGVVSRLSEEKGLQYLLRAIPKCAKEIPFFKIYVAGEGAYRRNLESRVESLKLNQYVQFLGHIGNVRELLKRIDLFVQPSRSESFGVAIMEAMSMGIPVVATRVGGIPEI